jgi:hypothetical protein
MSAVTPVTAPAPAVAAGVALALVPSAVILVLAVVLNWGR